MKSIIDNSLSLSLLFPHLNTFKKCPAFLLQRKIYVCCCSAESGSALSCKKVIRCCCSSKGHIKMRVSVNSARHKYQSFRINNLSTVLFQVITYKRNFLPFYEDISFVCITGSYNSTVLYECFHPLPPYKILMKH